MSRFGRQWTIELHISSQSFLNAFHLVVQRDEVWVSEKPYILANNHHKDFFGAIQKGSFRIWKRPGLFDFRGVPEVYGKITDNGSSIQLELIMINNFRFNYFSILFLDIVIGFFLLLVFNGITGMGSTMTGMFRISYLITVGLAMCCLAHYLQLKLIDRYLDNLTNLYNRVLLTIESTARTKRYSG
jgi:hypothetical protein